MPGHAVMDVDTLFPGGNFVAATSCSGFQYCDGLPNWDNAGPVAIDVIPDPLRRSRASVERG